MNQLCIQACRFFYLCIMNDARHARQVVLSKFGFIFKAENLGILRFYKQLFRFLFLKHREADFNDNFFESNFIF